jgi:hypothetical protein
MTKDEALDKAQGYLDGLIRGLNMDDTSEAVQVRDAIKQARALDKKAENARELGLDYEPADGTQVSKVWWDGEKLMAKPIPLEDLYQPVQEPVAFFDWYDNAHWGNEDFKEGCHRSWNAAIKYTTPPAQPAPVREPVAWAHKEGLEKINDFDASIYARGGFDDAVPLYTTPPAAQKTWVGLTDEKRFDLWKATETDNRMVLIDVVEAELKEQNR